MRIAIGAAALLLSSSCSLFGPREQTITVQTDPAGATVVTNGFERGETPIRFTVYRGEEILVEVKKEGYRAEYRRLRREFSALGIVDIIGTSFFLVPVFGLLSPAAWKHSPATIGIELIPKEPSSL